LHENRISHRDILEQNFVINAFGHRMPEVPSKPLRAAKDVRHAYIDFGESLIFPMSTDADSVFLTES
jgi:serine/threonine protein kinase